MDRLTELHTEIGQNFQNAGQLQRKGSQNSDPRLQARPADVGCRLGFRRGDGNR